MQYVALLRGIHPMNPNMRNAKLEALFQKMGFTNIASVIASGNILFESKSPSVKSLQKKIETAIAKELGFKSATIVRSNPDLKKLVKRNPFKGLTDSRSSQFNVTFLQSLPKRKPVFPKGEGYKVLGIYDGAVCTTIDLSKTKTPNLMTELERRLGKEITTRTWKTVARILAKMENTQI